MFSFLLTLMLFALWIAVMAFATVAKWAAGPLPLLGLVGLLIAVTAMTQTEEPAPNPKSPRAPPTGSGFLTSASIKTLLVSGTSLFLFSVYLFLRSYWALISSTGKFAGLVAVTLALYGLGATLYRKKIVPTTSQALIGIGLALIPACVYGANVMVFSNRFTNDAMLSLGCALLAPATAITMTLLPTAGLGLLAAASVVGAGFFGAAAFTGSAQVQAMALPAGAAVAAAFGLALRSKEEIATGIYRAVGLALATDLLFLWSAGFFWHETALIPTVVNFALMGAVLAAVSRRRPAAAYGASLSFTISALYFLRHLQIPVYDYGYLLVPAGLISLLRARFFEKSGQPKLARPYFALGQIALALSVICVLPVIGSDVSMAAIVAALAAASLGYAASGTMYDHPFYCYASGLVGLFIAATVSCQSHLDASSSAFVFAAVASVFVLVGFTGGRLNERRLGDPMVLLGLLTMTACVAFLAGVWLEEIWRTGVLAPPADMGRVEAGMWTGALGGAAYLFAAVTKKRPAFLYMALFSFSWVYVCALQWNAVPVTLVALSMIVVASMIGFVLLEAMKKPDAARCFALWAQMAGLFIMAGACVAIPERGVAAMIICTLAFAPGLFLARTSLSVSFLLGFYLTHFVWFHQGRSIVTSSDAQIAEYALQLVAVNVAVVFVRSLITWIRPQRSVLPFQIMAVAAAAVSLSFSMANTGAAWQVFIANGLLLAAVSRLHYDGRFDWPALVLCLLGIEILFLSRKTPYIEAYTLPFVVVLLSLGFKNRSNAALRDMLYGIALVVLYLPSSAYALHETWEWHGIFLGLTSLSMMLFGIHQRSRVLTFPSAVILVLNGFVQSRQLFLLLPRWIYLGATGMGLITLAGLFEFQRDAIASMKKSVSVTFEDWD